MLFPEDRFRKFRSGDTLTLAYHSPRDVRWRASFSFLEVVLPYICSQGGVVGVAAVGGPERSCVVPPAGFKAGAGAAVVFDGSVVML